MSESRQQSFARVQKSLPSEIPLTATHERFLAERPEGADEDVHMTRDIVDRVIEQYSEPGDLVFDPFAGFGTTLERAVKLGRRAVGIELLPERVEHVRQEVPGAHVIEGDAREFSRLLQGSAATYGEEVEGGADLILTSPPYMTRNEHEADPLTAYERDGGDYERYLAELGLVAKQCADVLRPGGVAVWNVADIHYLNVTTPLIADCARVLSECLQLIEIREIEWDQPPHDLVRDALVIMRGA